MSMFENKHDWNWCCDPRQRPYTKSVDTFQLFACLLWAETRTPNQSTTVVGWSLGWGCNRYPKVPQRIYAMRPFFLRILAGVLASGDVLGRSRFSMSAFQSKWAANLSTNSTHGRFFLLLCLGGLMFLVYSEASSNVRIPFQDFEHL